MELTARFGNELVAMQGETAPVNMQTATEGAVMQQEIVASTTALPLSMLVVNINNICLKLYFVYTPLLCRKVTMKSATIFWVYSMLLLFLIQIANVFITIVL